MVRKLKDFNGFLIVNEIPNYPLFYKQRFLSALPQCCLTFSWIEFQILLKCCLMPIAIIITWHILYLICLCKCLGLGLFMSYLSGLFFIFSLIFLVVNLIILLVFRTFLRLSPIILGWRIIIIISYYYSSMKKMNNFQIEKVQPQGVA